MFALTFAMGVVTGITMSFQFGTNWPGYMAKVGNIAGPLLAYEVLFAFFLEATFLGVMLFGMNRVPSWVHIFSAAMVAIGTTVSAFWIIALNSWMQTPTGHVMDGGALIAGDWWRVIFNPSLPYRMTHMLLASGLTASFVIAGLSAWRLLRATRRRLGAAHAAHRRRARRGAGAIAGFGRRPARPQHARAPAGEDRRDRSDLENRARRAAGAVRDAERGHAQERLCS